MEWEFLVPNLPVSEVRAQVRGRGARLMRRALVLLLLVPVVTGCGAKQVSQDPVSETSDSQSPLTDQPNAAESSRFDLTVRTRDGVAIQAIGIYDYAKRLGRLNFFFESTGTQGADGPGGEEPSDQIVFVDGTSYTSVGDLADSLGGKRWIESDLADAGLDAPFGVSPAGLLRFVRAVTAIEKIGSEKVRGVKTDHYRAELVIDRAVEQAPAEEREAVRAFLDAYWSGHARTPVEVWLDYEGRLRKVEADVPGLDKAEIGWAEVLVEFFDYGVPVEIHRPTADEVLTWGEFVELSMEACNKLAAGSGLTESAEELMMLCAEQ